MKVATAPRFSALSSKGETTSSASPKRLRERLLRVSLGRNGVSLLKDECWTQWCASEAKLAHLARHAAFQRHVLGEISRFSWTGATRAPPLATSCARICARSAADRHAAFPSPGRKTCRMNAPRRPQSLPFLHREGQNRAHFRTHVAQGPSISAPAGPARRAPRSARPGHAFRGKTSPQRAREEESRRPRIHSALRESTRRPASPTAGAATVCRRRAPQARNRSPHVREPRQLSPPGLLSHPRTLEFALSFGSPKGNPVP